MKMIGVKAGIPDLVILSPPPNFPLCRGAVIEMKRRKGSSVSEAQKVWLQYFADYDWATCVANGADEAIRQLEEWGY